MIRSLTNSKIYVTTLSGGLGGLLGYIISFLIIIATGFGQDDPLITAAIQGICVGMGFGVALMLAATRDTTSAVLSPGFQGLVAGLLAGISLIIGEYMIQNIQGGVIVRGISWGIFGGLLGFAIGLRSPASAWAFGAGGLLGGLLGGFLRGGLQNWIADETVGVQLGIVITGMIMGIGIITAETITRKVWLERVRDISPQMKQHKKGLLSLGSETYTLDIEKSLRKEGQHIGCDRKQIGSSGILIMEYEDYLMAPKHATLISPNKKQIELVNVAGRDVRVNSDEVKDRRKLNDSDEMIIGSTKFIFYVRSEKDTKETSSSSAIPQQTPGEKSAAISSRIRIKDKNMKSF